MSEIIGARFLRQKYCSHNRTTYENGCYLCKDCEAVIPDTGTYRCSRCGKWTPRDQQATQRSMVMDEGTPFNYVVCKRCFSDTKY